MASCEDELTIESIDNEAGKESIKNEAVINTVNCGNKGWHSGATENRLIVSINGNLQATHTIQEAETECLKVLLKKNPNTKRIESDQKIDFLEQQNEDNSNTIPDTDNTSNDTSSTMSGLNKHSITDSESTSHSPNKKFKHDSILDYKLENYISEKEINDMIKKYETYSVEKRTCAVYDMNTISTITHNIVINPESGEIESIVRKDFDKTTPQQCFLVSPQQNNTSLDIIQEETGNDDDSYQSSDSDDRSSVRLCSNSTLTLTDVESDFKESPKPELDSCRLKKSTTLTSNLNMHGVEGKNWVLDKPSTSHDEPINQLVEIPDVVEKKPPDRYDNIITHSDHDFQNKSAILEIKKILQFAQNEQTDRTRTERQTVSCDESSDEIPYKINFQELRSRFSSQNTDSKPSAKSILPNTTSSQKVSFAVPNFHNDNSKDIVKLTTTGYLQDQKFQKEGQYGAIRRGNNEESKTNQKTISITSNFQSINSKDALKCTTTGYLQDQKFQKESQYGTIQRGSSEESKINERYNISCDKCGNHMQMKENMYSSNDSIYSTSQKSPSSFTFYPANIRNSGTLMSSTSSKRNSSYSADRNSTYSMSSDSMSIGLNCTNDTLSNHNRSSSSGTLSRNSPYGAYGTMRGEYKNDVSRRFIPIRHSSYNAVNRLSMCSTLSSTGSSIYSTLSRNSINSSGTSRNSSNSEINKTSTSNSDKIPLYSLPNKSNRYELKTTRQNIQKSFSTPSMYKSKSTSETSDSSYEQFRKKQYKPSTGNPVRDEVTNSLNELSKKYDAYIKNKEYVESSSDTNTDSTVRYVPDDLDILLKSDEPEYANVSIDKVPTLKKLSLKAILSYENGIDLLSNIYFVPPQKSTHLNKLVKGTKCCQCLHHDHRLVPRRKEKPVKFDSNLYEMHQKFAERRGYYENVKIEPRGELQVEDIYSPKTPRSCIFNVDENYTKELLEEAANLLALRKYRETRIRNTVNRHYLDQNFDLVTYKVETPTLNSRLKSTYVKHDEPKRTATNSQHHKRLLELIQNKKQFTIDQIENNVRPRTPHNETKINTNRSQSFTVEKSHSAETVTNRQHPKVQSIKQVKQGTKSRPQSIPNTTNSQPDYRQVMYTEYMNKIAERLERRQKKVIRITTKGSDTAPTMVKIFNETVSKEKPCSLEEEFMQKARTRLHKLGFDLEEYSSNETTEEESSVSSRMQDEIPSHIREFLQFSQQGTINEQGVWSPGQTRKLERRSSDVGDHQKESPKNDSGSNTPIVWSPRSAPSSPISDRKSYRPVKFDSPTLSRKTVATKTSEPEQTSNELNFKRTTNTAFTPVTKKKNAHSQTPVCDNGYENSKHNQATEESKEIQSIINTSNSTNSVNLNFNSTSKLPRAQNPTITLLQKAREGQLPRGALYLDHIMNEKETRETNKRNIESNEITYTVQRQYESENENSKRPKKMAQHSERKIDGIGPTTKEGIPTILRSEIRDKDHQKWYKQMYESLHKSYDDNDFVTVRYKTKARDRGYIHSGGGYQSEPEQFSGYNSDFDASRYTTYDDRNSRNKENQFTFGTIPRSSSSSAVKHAVDVYKNQPGRIEDYIPGHSSIAQKETKQWWDEVMDMFDNNLHEGTYSPASHRKPFSTLHGSGYESDSTLVFKRREDNQQQAISPAEQRSLYKSIQMGGEVPLHGLRKPAPEKPKEPVTRSHESFHQLGSTGRINDENRYDNYESPHKYAESEVTLQYKIPVRNEIKEAWSEEELNRRQAETMRRIYQEERRRKYLQELQDMSNRRHTDNLLPSQKSPIPLNRYDDVLEEPAPQRSRSRTPEPKLVARALYHFTGQTSRELTFRKGDIIFVKRQIDKNWYEGEHNAMVGLFPINYIEIIPYDEIRTLPKRPSEGQARAKFNFVAQTNLELSLVKGELIVLTRRVDDNWYEGRVGNRRGIFPVSYVHVIREPGEYKDSAETTHNNIRKPVAAPAAHSLITNQQSLPSQHNYQPNSYTTPITLPRTSTRSQREASTLPLNEALHIDTSSEPIPYRALYNYKPQNEDELELKEGDTVYVMEKCDDGWYVGSSQRTSHFGTFPGNYVERIS